MTWREYKKIIKNGYLYYSYSIDDKIYEKNCHALVFSDCHTNIVVKNYYSFNTTPYSKEEIYEYVSFLNDCGFKMNISKTDKVFIGDIYSRDNNKQFDLYISLAKIDYISTVHFKIALTLQRMLSYYILEGLQNIITDALNIYKELKITDPYECLTTAFNSKESIEVDDFFIKNHNLMGGNRDVKIMKKEDLLIIVAKKDIQTIRDINK